MRFALFALGLAWTYVAFLASVHAFSLWLHHDQFRDRFDYLLPLWWALGGLVVGWVVYTWKDGQRYEWTGWRVRVTRVAGYVVSHVGMFVLAMHVLYVEGWVFRSL